MDENEKVKLQALGDKLRIFRQQKNLSQEKLAELASLDRTFISGLERGLRNPSFLILEKIIHVLEINPNELFSNK